MMPNVAVVICDVSLTECTVCTVFKQIYKYTVLASYFFGVLFVCCNQLIWLSCLLQAGHFQIITSQVLTASVQCCHLKLMQPCTLKCEVIIILTKIYRILDHRGGNPEQAVSGKQHTGSPQ